MSLPPSLAPSPDSSGAEPSSNATQALTFISLSIVIFLVCFSSLSIIMWCCWRKSRREYEAFRQRQEAADTPEGSIKKQVRLPIVIVNPDNDVEYGRKESQCFFMAAPLKPDSSKTTEEPELPNTPAPGTYYIEERPGYFEVEVEVSGQPQHVDSEKAIVAVRSTSRVLLPPRDMQSPARAPLSPPAASSEKSLRLNHL